MAKILTAYGQPYEPEPSSAPPKMHRDPPLQLPGKLRTKAQFESVVAAHDYGWFQVSAYLARQMIRCGRVASGVQTRADALTGTEIQFLPGQNNDKGRRAARDIETDWPLIATPSTRAQLSIWGWFMGSSMAQKNWYISDSGRWIPRLEPYNAQWTNWDWGTYAYRVWTWNDGIRTVPSPSLQTPGQPFIPVSGVPLNDIDDPRLWVVHEPYGVHSWASDLNFIHSLWEDYFGYALANNDMNRVCEKQGRGQLKLKYPRSTDKASRDEYMAKLLDVGAEGIFPLEQYLAEEGIPGYELEPFTWPSTGFDIVAGTKQSNADAITGRILGHNTQGETKGATGTQGGAQTGDKVRADIRVADCAKEKATFEQQVLRDWAALNYGDPDLAPVMVYVTEEPMANVAAAQTIQFLASAVPLLRQHTPGVDFTELFRGFKIPMAPTGAMSPEVRALVAAPVEQSTDTASAAPAPTDTTTPDMPAESKPLDITPTDVAAIATVDEGRASLGLPAVGGDVGDRWIVEHSARVKADAAPQIAEVARADAAGDQPADPASPEAP